MTSRWHHSLACLSCRLFTLWHYSIIKSLIFGNGYFLARFTGCDVIFLFACLVQIDCSRHASERWTSRLNHIARVDRVSTTSSTEELAPIQPVALHLGCLRTICLSVVCHLVNDEERLSFSVWQSHKWSIHSFKMRQTISSSAGSDVNTNTLYNREKMVMMMKMNREERRHRDRLCFYSSCFSFRAIMIKF